MTDRQYQSLKWRCRRGTKELDRQLMRYLDHAYGGMSADERAIFTRFLALDDPLLSDWLSGARITEDEVFSPLVRAIRAINRNTG